MPEWIKNHLLVTKPGIVVGNMISVAGGFFLASKGDIDIALLFSTLMGASLVIASGCVFNNWIDRNVDRKMARTRNRVLAKGLMSTKVAVSYGSLLGIAGLALLWAETNMLSVSIVLSGFGIYVGLYSLYLKRHSVYATLIGSLAGAAPPLAGYCAVNNSFDMGAVILLLIFSLWQMPHSYAIAIFRYKDYAGAALPVLPVKQGLVAAKRHILGYMLAFVAATLMLTFGGYAGYGYLAVSAAMGLSWLRMAWLGHKTSDDRVWAKQMFVASIVTINVLSVMMTIDFTPATPEMVLAHAPKFNDSQRSTFTPTVGYTPICHTGFPKGARGLPRFHPFLVIQRVGNQDGDAYSQYLAGDLQPLFGWMKGLISQSGLKMLENVYFLQQHKRSLYGKEVVFSQKERTAYYLASR